MGPWRTARYRDCTIFHLSWTESLVLCREVLSRSALQLRSSYCTVVIKCSNARKCTGFDGLHSCVTAMLQRQRRRLTSEDAETEKLCAAKSQVKK